MMQFLSLKRFMFHLFLNVCTCILKKIIAVLQIEYTCTFFSQSHHSPIIKKKQIANSPSISHGNKPLSKQPDNSAMPLPALSAPAGTPSTVSQSGNLQSATMMQPQLLQTCGAQATIGLIQVPMVNRI